MIQISLKLKQQFAFLCFQNKKKEKKRQLEIYLHPVGTSTNKF